MTLWSRQTRFSGGKSRVTGGGTWLETKRHARLCRAPDTPTKICLAVGTLAGPEGGARFVPGHLLPRRSHSAKQPPCAYRLGVVPRTDVVLRAAHQEHVMSPPCTPQTSYLAVASLWALHVLPQPVNKCCWWRIAAVLEDGENRWEVVKRAVVFTRRA